MDMVTISSMDEARTSQMIGVALFEGHTHDDISLLPEDIARYVRRAAEMEDFKGKAGSSLIVPVADDSVHFVALAGLGAREKATPNSYRLATYKIVRAAAKRGMTSVSIALASRDGGWDISCARCAEAIGEGAALAPYRFDKYKTRGEDDRWKSPDRVAVLGVDGGSLRDGVAAADAQCWARDLANEPGNVIDPSTFEEAARSLARDHGLDIEVFEEEDLRRKGMNALLSVGSGSKTPPRLIHLTYRGGSRARCALVGKGITFDSGGLSLKPADVMLTMKGDKTGACVVMGVLRGAARMHLPIEIHAVMGLAENMPSGSAYRPDDLIKAYNGKTIEINNTDAEGRVTLADALSYACELKPDFVIDIATLTGACAVALGDATAGLFATDDALADQLLDASRTTGERLWRLPLDDEHLREKVKSPFADVINSAGRYGGAITAAMFLEAFVEKETPWAHLDIAATDFTKEERDVFAKGATAFGCRTLLTFLRERGK